MIKEPLYLQIYNDILTKIKEGHYQKGDRVPSEIELAEEFNVSRITSKRALDLLAQHQVVHRKRGKGSYVLHDDHQLHGLYEPQDTRPARRRKIGLVVPGIGATYGLETMRQVEKEVRKRGDLLLLLMNDNDVVEEANAIRKAVEEQVDGLLITPVNGQHYNEQILRLSLENFPIVFIDRHLPGLPIPGVYTDNFEAAKLAVNYFLDKKIERVAYLTPVTDGTASLEMRLKGFKAAVQQRQLSSTQTPVVEGSFYKNPQLLFSALDGLEVDAYVSSENAVDELLTQWMRANQVKLPHLCFDYTEKSVRSGRPAVSYIQQDEVAMARKSSELLYQLIEGEVLGEFQYLSPFKLILGESTGMID